MIVVWKLKSYLCNSGSRSLIHCLTTVLVTAYCYRVVSYKASPKHCGHFLIYYAFLTEF
jgi:hypothetical protein